LQCWTHGSAPSYFYADEAPPPKLDIHFTCSDDVDGAATRAVLVELCEALPLHAVRGFTIAHARVARQDLASLLIGLTSARELCVHGSMPLRALCAALKPTGPGRDAPLPALDTLSVNEAVFRSGGVRDADYSALVAALGARSVVGVRLPHLVVCYSDAMRQDLEDLAGVVADLVWDGSLQGRASVPVAREPEQEPSETEAEAEAGAQAGGEGEGAGAGVVVGVGARVGLQMMLEAAMEQGTEGDSDDEDAWPANAWL